MIKYFCDKCERDVTQDDRYSVKVLKIGGDDGKDKPAMMPMEICGHCKVALSEHLGGTRNV